MQPEVSTRDADGDVPQIDLNLVTVYRRDLQIADTIIGVVVFRALKHHDLYQLIGEDRDLALLDALRLPSQPEHCPHDIDRHRTRIERCWSRLKKRRAIATRCDKTARSYAAGIAIAIPPDWLKSAR